VRYADPPDVKVIGTAIPRRYPQHLIAEPSSAHEVVPKAGHRSKQRRCPGHYGFVNIGRGHERNRDAHMGWDAEPSDGV
jgi:hypothetical protein